MFNIGTMYLPTTYYKILEMIVKLVRSVGLVFSSKHWCGTYVVLKYCVDQSDKPESSGTYRDVLVLGRHKLYVQLNGLTPCREVLRHQS